MLIRLFFLIVTGLVWYSWIQAPAVDMVLGLALILTAVTLAIVSK